MPSVDLTCFSGLFFGSNLLGIEVSNDPKCLGKEPWKFRRLRDNKLRRKNSGSVA